MRFIKNLPTGKVLAVALGIAVLFVAYITYFRHYWYPPNLFWDENYHIASAQKYLDGVFFMEPHPPLGKLFIALGEALIHPNNRVDTSSFTATDYIQGVPAGYSFAGVRFFPSLFAMLSAVVFYLILLELSKKPVLSFLFTSFYLFENAIIVHSRGAMLEPIQLFFILLCVWFFLASLRDKPLGIRYYAGLGILWGLAMAVKLNSVSVGLLLPVLFAYETWLRPHAPGRGRLSAIADFAKKTAAFGLAAVMVFASVYYLHIAIAQRVVDGRYYEASRQYKEILVRHEAAKIAFFPRLLAEQIGFISHYEKGVPKYDACKPGENGSLPVTWPVGDKSINYRWETRGDSARYLYLQGNPAVWFFGLLGLFLAANLVVSRFLFRLPAGDRRLFFLICTFLGLYLAYMGSVLTLERVMYLYHYFIPLVWSIFLFFLMFLYLSGSRKAGRRRVLAGAFLLTGAVIACFVFFSPLTYYQPLTRVQFQAREWFSFWGLKPVN